jgi:hypothetical protein
MAQTKKKRFDAVAQSRRWRRATGRLLNTMSPEEQLVFLNRRLASWPGAPEAAPAPSPARR